MLVTLARTSFNPLPNDKILDWSKLKASADDKINVTQNLILSLNIFILHRLRNKFLQLILMFLDSASWELHQYSRRMCEPMKKIQKLTPAPENRTRDLKIAKPTLYLTKIDIGFRMGRKHGGKRRKCWLLAFSPFPTMFSNVLSFRVVKIGIVL